MDEKIDTKPIVNVMNDLHSINRNMNQLKIDLMCIKSDIALLKELIIEKEKKTERNIEGMVHLFINLNFKFYIYIYINGSTST